MSPRDVPDRPWLVPRKDLRTNAWTDRDLAWLEFNRRVLEEARDPRTPLLERVKFLAIFGSNLDEFFMKRMCVLRGKARPADEGDPGARANDAHEHLNTIRRSVLEMLSVQAECYSSELLPALRERGIVLARWNELSEARRAELGLYFDAQISPALTPLGFDPTHPFPIPPPKRRHPLPLGQRVALSVIG